MVPASSYRLLLLLTVMNVMNFIDRSLLSSFASFIVPDLNLTNTEFGLLTGLVFVVFYATAGLFMGALGDTVSRPRLIAAAMVAWSAFTAASGLAKNFISLAIPRMFIGIGESALTPNALSLLADRFPRERRAFATGVYYMGVPVGEAMSLIIAGVLGPAIGWRMCFYVLGGLGVLLALTMLNVKETRPKVVRPQGERRPVGGFIKTFIAALRESPALQLIILGGVIVNFQWGSTNFGQLWLVRDWGYDRAEIAVLIGITYGVTGIVGNLVGGWACDRWVAATGQSRLMFMFWMLLLILPLNLTLRLSDPHTPVFWVCLVGVYFQSGIFFGPSFAAVQELCRPQVRATMLAFYLLSINVGGTALGTTLSGLTVDQLIARGVVHPYSWMLFGFALLGGLALPCYLGAARAEKRAPALAVAGG